MARHDPSNTVGDAYRVPEDFPLRKSLASVSGVQAKLPMSEHGGRFYVDGNSPPERYRRYVYCRELAEWFAEKCVRNEHGKYQGMTRTRIIRQYHVRLLAMRSVQLDDVSEEEATWVMHQCAEILEWPFREEND
jgi:hypothetical protein